MDKAFSQCFSKGLSLIVEGNEAVEFYISTNPGEDFEPPCQGSIWWRIIAFDVGH